MRKPATWQRLNYCETVRRRTAEIARDLAYRLFNICEKKKLSQ